MDENVASTQSVTSRVVLASLLPLLFVLCVGAALAAFKLSAIGLTPSGDYAGYLETAQLFRGAPEAAAPPGRILKPLNPILVAVEESVMTPAAAFLAQVIVFYFLFLVACYFLGRAFGFANRESAVLALLLGASYPALKYGVDLYTETGAWFFYIASLALTVWYLRAPSVRLLLINTLVLITGFFWKEYSIVSAMVFGFAILFHPALSWRARIGNVALFGGLFLFVNLLWQLYVYVHYQYTYFSWYTTAGTAGFKTEFTLKNLVKSTGAILGLAWLLVPFGASRFSRFTWWQKRFFVLAVPASLLVFFWGYVSSRLFFVMAPAFALLALFALGRIQNLYLRYGMLTFILGGNVAWLILSTKVTI